MPDEMTLDAGASRPRTGGVSVLRTTFKLTVTHERAMAPEDLAKLRDAAEAGADSVLAEDSSGRTRARATLGAANVPAGKPASRGRRAGASGSTGADA